MKLLWHKGQWEEALPDMGAERETVHPWVIRYTITANVPQKREKNREGATANEIFDLPGRAALKTQSRFLLFNQRLLRDFTFMKIQEVHIDGFHLFSSQQSGVYRGKYSSQLYLYISFKTMTINNIFSLKIGTNTVLKCLGLKGISSPIIEGAMTS